jgi:uncharacterized membrane protein YfcA
VTDISGLAHIGAGGAAIGAGIVNAIAGGGTLISFPALTAMGVPAVRANATNTVALCPGYIGGTYAQRRDLRGLGTGIRPLLVASVLGGLAGSILLVVSSEALFKSIVPYLILGACALLAVQDRLRTWLRSRATDGHSHALLELGAVTVGSVYGGYFGAGLGIMLMAVLGLFSDLPFNRLNAVKQMLSFLVNISAAAFLVFSGKLEWTLLAVMAPCSLVGGHMGGKLASSLQPRLLRGFVIVFGVVVAIWYLVR